MGARRLSKPHANGAVNPFSLAGLALYQDGDVGQRTDCGVLSQMGMLSPKMRSPKMRVNPPSAVSLLFLRLQRPRGDDAILPRVGYELAQVFVRVGNENVNNVALVSMWAKLWQ
jgi:hypothetical protein